MQSTQRTLKRTIMTLCLVLTLGVAPTLTVYAQQPVQTQASRQTKSSVKAGQQAKEEKQEPAEEDTLLSDAEMEKVKGGVVWFPIIAAGVGAAVGAGGAYLSSRQHQKILRACTPTRRR